MGGAYRTAGEKLKVLRLAERLGDVSEACRRAGVSRDAFYRWRRALRARGQAGLSPTSRRRPLPALRVSPELEAEVLALTRKWPEWGKRRVAARLDLRVGPTAVLAVWVRHGVGTTARARLAWAGQAARAKVPERRVEVECPACHRSFAGSGAPPFTCPSCGVGGVPARVSYRGRAR